MSLQFDPFHKSDADQGVQQNQGIAKLAIHESIVQRLDGFIAKNQIPHIIFHGPSGSGKLTLVREFIGRIYANDRVKTKTHVMTVNCSHGKGIQFIREELKFFAKANAQSKSSGDFKIILLLNAHHLTVDAQSALRRCIELFSYNTRFFIVVENKNKLLNPILSRFCDVFVPEPVHPITGLSLNLHGYVLSQQFGNDLSSAQRFEIILKTMKDNELSSTLSPDTIVPFIPESSQQIMEMVNRLYESGISCIDLMEYINRTSEKDRSTATMRFYQIKPQFRCEKLLMLYMVNFMICDASF